MTQHLVLVGGGHAHAHVLVAFGRRPEPGVRVTLVTRDLFTAYSGMLPGQVAGVYSRAQAQIDMATLARRTGARFIQAEIDGLDRAAKAILSGGREVARYDLLSLDTGATPDLSVPGAADYALPVKPIPEFLAGWDGLRASAENGTLRVLVVGGGVGGAELSLAVRAGLPGGAHSVILATRETLASEQNARARQLLAAALERNGVALVEQAEIVEVQPDTAVTADGRRIGFDALIWTTGATAPDWLRGTGLTLDRRGFVAVDATLRSLNAADIFAAGDVATALTNPRPKAGVFAVRQGPPLADNLRRALRGRPLLPFTPQQTALALIGTGDGRAIAAKGRFAAEGRWVWRLKGWIDRRWIARYQA